LLGEPLKRSVRLLLMNYIRVIVTIIFALTLVTVATARTIQAPDKLTFKMDLCGIGTFSSHQMYTVSDGTTLNVDSKMYMTLDKAKKARAKQLKVARRITDRTDLLDETGKKIGERIIFVTGNADNQRTVSLTIRDKFVYRIEAASLRHINAFRDWENATEQALGADSGRQFTSCRND
jgi:hypothetical protein